MILIDVHEIWRRRKIHLCDTSAPSNNQKGDNAENRLKSLGIKIPVVKVKSLNRKYVECSRYVPQLMIRGEHIAIVTLDNTNK